MREIRTYGSEGGGAEANRLFLPLSQEGGLNHPVKAEHCDVGWLAQRVPRLQLQFPS